MQTVMKMVVVAVQTPKVEPLLSIQYPLTLAFARLPRNALFTETFNSHISAQTKQLELRVEDRARKA